MPQQALFSMNAPFVIEQAKALAARPDVAGAIYDRGADRRALPRGPGPVLRSRPRPRRLSRFLAPGRSRAGLTPGALFACPRSEQLAQVLLMTNEFMFVD